MPAFDESVQFINQEVLSPAPIQAESMGKAVQSMSHSLALALQDATDNQRNFEAVNTAALSKATQEMIATKDVATWSPIITALQTAKATQEAAFAKLSTDIEGLLKNLPMPTGGQ